MSSLAAPCEATQRRCLACTRLLRNVLIGSRSGRRPAVVTVVPEDSLAAWAVTFSALALVVAAGGVSFAAIFRRSERALSVYAAALVLVGGILFLLLHSLFISE